MTKRRGIAGIMPGHAVEDWHDKAKRLDQTEHDWKWERLEMAQGTLAVGSALLSEYVSGDRLVAYYRHPVHPEMSAVHEVRRTEIAEFLNERINLSRHEGVDLIIADLNLRPILGFNHDGDCFLIRPCSP